MFDDLRTLCDTLSVSGGNDANFNGIYEISNFTVSWAIDEEVYHKKDGDKFIFPVRSSTNDEWGIGSKDSLLSGDVDYRGKSLIIHNKNTDVLRAYITWHNNDHLLKQIE